MRFQSKVGSNRPEPPPMPRAKVVVRGFRERVSSSCETYYQAEKRHGNGSMAGKITVLAQWNRISTFYSVWPLLQADWASRCTFTQSLDFCMTRDDNQVLLILRFFSDGRTDKVCALERLRQKYRTVIWFDDGDGGGCTSFEVMPYVDQYWKKQVYRDISQYQARLYGRQIYADYYARTAGVADEVTAHRAPLNVAAHGAKIKLAWNIGAGIYPMSALRQRLGVLVARMGGVRMLGRWKGAVQGPPIPITNPKELFVFARFGDIPQRASIGYQRRLFTRVMRDTDPKLVRFLQGRAPKRQYDREIGGSAVTLSPFGWGEICFRDFEAIASGSVLLKPDMAHLKTWPDVYHEEETYVPVRWDGSDLVERAEKILGSRGEREAMAQAAQEAWHVALRRMPDQVDARLGDLL
jgi:hypothetical protein